MTKYESCVEELRVTHVYNFSIQWLIFFSQWVTQLEPPIMSYPLSPMIYIVYLNRTHIDNGWFNGSRTKLSNIHSPTTLYWSHYSSHGFTGGAVDSVPNCRALASGSNTGAAWICLCTQLIPLWLTWEDT